MRPGAQNHARRPSHRAAPAIMISSGEFRVLRMGPGLPSRDLWEQGISAPLFPRSTKWQLAGRWRTLTVIQSKPVSRQHMRHLFLFMATLFALASAADRAEAHEPRENGLTCEGCPTFVPVPASDTTPITHVAQYELTWNQYLVAVDSGVCPLPPLFDRRFQPFTIAIDSPLFSEFRRDYAISNLRPSDVQCYIDWLSKRIGATVRLPTYREWEWFARSGAPNRRFPWGNEEDPTREALVRQYVRDVLHQPHVNPVTEVRVSHIILGTHVGLFPPTEWGLYDLLGNVPELTSDVITPANVARYREELDMPIRLRGDQHRIIKGQVLLVGGTESWRAGISHTSLVSEADNAFSFSAGVRLVLE